MLHVYMFISVMCCILCMQGSPVHGNSCDQNMASVCDRLYHLQAMVDVNSVHLTKWNSHYDFVQRLNNNFEGEISSIVNDVISGMPVQNPTDGSSINSNKIADILMDIKNLQNSEIRYKEERESYSEKLESTENDIQEVYKILRKVENKHRKLKYEVAGKMEEMKREQKEEFSMFATRAENKFRDVKDEILQKMEESRKESRDILSTISSQTQVTEKKVNETQEMIISITSVHKILEDVNRANISASNVNMEQHLLEFQKIQSNLSLKIRAFEIELSTLNTQYASSYDLMNRTLQDVSNFTKTAEQSLRNHSFEVSGLKLKMDDFENRCDYPPSIKHGYIVNRNRRHGAVLTYNCQGKRTLVDNGKVQCHFGEWIGNLPVCIENRCEKPPTIKYGYVVNRNRSHGSVLTYRCQDDMTLVYNGKVECCFGEWTGNLPVCMESCITNDLKAYSGLEVFTNVLHKHSETLRVRCSEDYHDPIPGRNIVCENGVWKVPDKPCIKGYFDATFVLRALNLNEIACYSYETYQNIKFSRLQGIGDGPIFPRDATIVSEENSSILQFRRLGSNEIYGGFQCEIDEEKDSFKIVTIMQKGEYYGNLYPLEAFKVANIGDMVEFEVTYTENKTEGPLQWIHNEKQVSSWEGRQKVIIPKVKLEDAGVYECFFEGKRNENEHAFIKLTVRKCGANMFGKNCDQECPKCYNGGICHDDYGMCICPAGFMGFNCEIPCESGHFGFHCSDKLIWRNLESQLFCKQEPFGCACAAGYKGTRCRIECDPGWYGADCKQKCHCAEGPDFCNIHTGVCTGGCSEGWKGASCQIECNDNTCTNTQES